VKSRFTITCEVRVPRSQISFWFPDGHPVTIQESEEFIDVRFCRTLRDVEFVYFRYEVFFIVVPAFPDVVNHVSKDNHPSSALEEFLLKAFDGDVGVPTQVEISRGRQTAVCVASSVVTGGGIGSCLGLSGCGLRSSVALVRVDLRRGRGLRNIPGWWGFRIRLW